MTGDLALGVDVGNAKLKACLANTAGALDWISRPLPYDDRARYRRGHDFERGIPSVLGGWLGLEGPAGNASSAADASRAARVRSVVVVSSSGYAYPSYRAGIVHLMKLVAELFPRAQCWTLGHHGTLVAARDVATARPEVVTPLLFTNGMGAAHLARRLDWLGAPPTGVVVDTGGTTSQVATFVDGEVEPAARESPATYLEHRLRAGKAVWIGTQTTPLEVLAEEVPVGDRRFPVLPRGVTFDAVSSALGLLPEVLARKLTLFQLVPTRADALRAIADAVNLDPEMATEDELLALARHFLARAVSKLADGLRRALATVPERARTRALVFGLGAEWLTTPALVEAGVPRDGIALARELLPEELAEAASCYGACHLALEQLTGRVRPARIGRDPTNGPPP